MNLQNLNYTINNLSPRQKIAILAGIVGASAVISTIALSQRQSSRTTVNQTPSSSISDPSSPIDATIPNTTGNFDATLAPGVDSSSTNPNSLDNNAAINGGNLNSSRTTNIPNNLRGGSSVVPGSVPLGNNGLTNSNSNPAIPSPITTSPNLNLTPTSPRGAVAPPIPTSPNLTTTSPPSRTFIPSASSPSGASTSPVIPSTTSPTQTTTIPSASTTPTNPLIQQENSSTTAPIDSPLPSSTQSIPTFDSRTGTYTTTTPRTPNNSSPGSSVNTPFGSLNSPSSTFNNSRNNSNFNSNFNSNPNFSRPSGGSNATSTSSPIYGNSNGTSSSNPIYSNPNGNINNSIYGTPNGGSTSNTSPNGTTTSGN